MEPWLASFEVGFPASTLDELLLALIVRDLLYGSSFDVETPDGARTFQVDMTASEEIDAGTYQLLLEAEIRGLDDTEAAGAFLEQVIEEAIDEAQELLDGKSELAVVDADALEFRVVAEDDERWDLVIPDWLAPEGAEVPFGFRSFRPEGGEPVPDDETLDAHGRVVVVPFGGKFTFFALPAPAETDHCS